MDFLFPNRTASSSSTWGWGPAPPPGSLVAPTTYQGQGLCQAQCKAPPQESIPQLLLHCNLLLMPSPPCVHTGSVWDAWAPLVGECWEALGLGYPVKKEESRERCLGRDSQSQEERQRVEKGGGKGEPGSSTYWTQYSPGTVSDLGLSQHLSPINSQASVRHCPTPPPGAAAAKGA